MKSKRNNNNNNKIKKFDKLDNKDKNFIKTFGEIHPINDIDTDLTRSKVQIVKDSDDEYSSSDEQKKFKYDQSNLDVNLEEAIDDVIDPYQQLLNDLNVENKRLTKRKKNNLLDSLNKKSKKQVKEKNIKTDEEIEEEEENEDELNDETDSQQDSNDSELDNNDDNINTYSQEVLCKDNLENDEMIKYDPFHIHFEQNIQDKEAEKLKNNFNDRQKLNQLKQNLNWPSLGNLIYSPVLEEKTLNLDPKKNIKQLFIKQRILERLNESVVSIIGEKSTDINENEEIVDKQNDLNLNEYKLDKSQTELLNIISNYADFYHSNVEVNIDTKIKFVYALHALNHALKTRSRIIAHNDKMKHNKSNTDIEYRDQGLTRPKILILVPYRKFALKLVKIIISLLMRKSEEFVSNKKRFYDAFGPVGDEDELDKDLKEQNEKEEKNKLNHDEDYDFLFTGNTEDHFKIGLSVSKKSLKLYTEFYSSDIIIASPLGLKSVIGLEGDPQQDHDFLSSIELLILDNSDVLMMQNWEHVMSIFDHLHLQPKKSHDTDFSRVRSWLLEGHARFYRQTLIFSRIPAPPINNIFNKYCQNFNGKYQIDLLKTPKYQLGTICKIGFQLAQVFNKIECESPVDLPKARFNFFIDKILPKFKDEMMSHTLIFIPSYFDFVKLRNYFKKNDINSMNVSEYTDDKSVDRARYLFYHGKVHFMLLTERFYFYKRYKIRGINHLIFYDLPNYAEYYSNLCNFLPDPKRFKNGAIENFSSTVLYSEFDAQKLCAIVGHQRATHMINSDKSVHMFMTE